MIIQTLLLVARPVRRGVIMRTAVQQRAGNQALAGVETIPVTAMKIRRGAQQIVVADRALTIATAFVEMEKIHHVLEIVGARRVAVHLP